MKGMVHEAVKTNRRTPLRWEKQFSLAHEMLQFYFWN
jgi:hypothetical protein